MIYLGIDGGGTMTTFCLCDSNGNILAQLHSSSLDYKQIGFDGYADRLQSGVEDLLSQINVSAEQLYGITVGTPCFGESTADSKELEKIALQVLPSSSKVFVVNDVLCAMYGALAGAPGICILSGTGSMAMGMDINGTIVRAGGLSHIFSDAGSCYWLGQQTMFLFAKQAEDIIEQSELYRIIMDNFHISEPLEIIPIFENIIQYRDQVAALQILLCKAAEEGDTSAISSYTQAAKELALLANSVRKRSSFDSSSKVKVSFAGSLFKARDLIISPLHAELESYNMSLVPPVLDPTAGAVLHALKHSDVIINSKIISALKRKQGE